MKKIYLFVLIVILALGDIILINSSLFLGFFITNKYLTDIDQQIYTQNIWSGNLIWLASSAIFKLYSLKTIRSFRRIYLQSFKSITLYGILFSTYLSFLSNHAFPVVFLFTLFTVMAISLVFSRFTAVALEALLPKKGKQESVRADIRHFKHEVESL